jgi:transcriptional regulator with XRE-family HTH domain
MLNLTQEQLAKRTGLHRTYITDLEVGNRNPTLKTLARLARALRLTIAEITRDVEYDPRKRTPKFPNL